MCAIKKISSLLLYLSVFFFTTGCHPVAKLYNGNVYKDAKIFPLDVAETTPAEFEAFQLKTSFTYSADSSDLAISGTAAMGNHYQLIYERIKDINLFLFFLDDNNYVIDGTRLYNAFNKDSSSTFPFKSKLRIPATATKIALGYEVNMSSSDSEGDPSGGGDWFYRLPLSSVK